MRKPKKKRSFKGKLCLSVSTGFNRHAKARANRPHKAKSWSWLCKNLHHPPLWDKSGKYKRYQPYFLRGLLSDQGRRCNANMPAFWLAVADMDADGLRKKDARRVAEALAGIRHIVYPSYSNHKHRFRVIVPLPEPLSPEYLRSVQDQLAAFLESVTGHRPAQESWVLSNPWFFGLVRKRLAIHISVCAKGKFFKFDPVSEQTAVSHPTPAPGDMDLENIWYLIEGIDPNVAGPVWRAVAYCCYVLGGDDAFEVWSAWSDLGNVDSPASRGGVWDGIKARPFTRIRDCERYLIVLAVRYPRRKLSNSRS